MGRRRRGASENRQEPAPEPVAATNLGPPPPARERLTAAAAGLVALAAYLPALSPTVGGGDSGELIAAVQVMGVVHPPGYPLYTLLGKLFTLLPAGTVAWRLSLFSAVCDALAAALLCAAVLRATGRPLCGLLASLAFAFSPLVWPYAVSQEVFALNNLFGAGQVFALAAFASAAGRGVWSPAWPVAVGLWTGLAMSNHHTHALLAAPCLLAHLWLTPAAQRVRALRLIVLGGLAGLLPYLYLPLASARLPAIAWGDLTSPGALLAHVLRREYGTFQLAASESGGARGGLATALSLLGQRFAGASFWLGPLLLLAAVPSLARRSPARDVARTLAFALALDVALFGSLANVRLDDPVHVTVLERFWQQPALVAAALMGFGAAGLARLAARRAWLVEAALAIGLGGAAVASGLPRPAPDPTFFRDYGAAILESLPPGALLVVSSDETVGSVRYLQQCEGLRTDVQVVPSGQLSRAWFRGFAARHLPGVALPASGFSFREFLDANATRQLVYLVNKEPWQRTLEEAYTVWPLALADRVRKKSDAWDLKSWVEEADAGFRFDPKRADARGGSWERYVAANCRRQQQRFATSLVTAAAKRGGDPGAAKLLAHALEQVAARNPSPEPVLFKNLGVAYQVLWRAEPGDAAWRRGMRDAWTRYLALAPASDRDSAAIRELLRQEAAAR